MSTLNNAPTAEMSQDTADPLAYLGTDPDTRQLFTDANNFLAIILNMLDDDQRQALYAANPLLWAVQVPPGWHLAPRNSGACSVRRWLRGSRSGREQSTEAAGHAAICAPGSMLGALLCALGARALPSPLEHPDDDGANRHYHHRNDEQFERTKVQGFPPCPT